MVGQTSAFVGAMFTTANGRFVIECPECHGFTMTEPDGAWACRSCAKTVLGHVDAVVRRKGFRPSVERRLAIVKVRP